VFCLVLAGRGTSSCRLQFWPSQFILVERDQSTKPNMNWRRVDSSCFCFLCLCFFVFALSFSPRSGKMVKLFVTVLGSKPITSVDIRGHDSVSELKKAIAAESPPPAPAAIDLSLYYARRDGQWLSSEDDDLMVLQPAAGGKLASVASKDAHIRPLALIAYSRVFTNARVYQ
jgi:hypothetical protein